jgi:hypothetical protein
VIELKGLRNILDYLEFSELKERVMYIEAILIGLLIGMIRNGRLTNFNNAKFRGWAIAILAFVVYLVPYGLKIFSIGFENPQWFPFAAMGLIGVVALANFDKTGMKLFFVGTLLNMAVMAFNGFMMPIDIEKMRALGFESFVESITNGTVVNYIDSMDATKWTVFFSKIIALPNWYPLARVISIGDIVISVGIALVIQSEMLLHSMRTKNSMVRFSYKSKI